MDWLDSHMASCACLLYRICTATAAPMLSGAWTCFTSALDLIYGCPQRAAPECELSTRITSDEFVTLTTSSSPVSTVSREGISDEASGEMGSGN